MQQDGYFLHFLKQFPAWIVLSTLFIFIIFCWLFLIVYHPTSERPIEFLGTIINLIIGGLLGLLTNRLVTPQQQSNVENVEKMTVNAPLDTPLDEASLGNLSETEIETVVEKIGEK